MTELKHCWQQDVFKKPTACFVIAGGIPCLTSGCTVDDALNGRRLDMSTSHDIELIENLCHSVCRISDSSEDNAEYRERVAALRGG